MTSKPQIRSQELRLRVTPEEKETLRDQATKRGLSLSDFARERILKISPLRKRRRRSLDEKAMASALAQLGRFGGNLNQIAHALNIIKMKSDDSALLPTLQGIEQQLSYLVADQKEAKHLIRQALLKHDLEG